MDSITDGSAVQDITEEMRAERRWVVWRYEQRDDKLTKVPVNPRTGEGASSADPSTWGSFEQASTRAAKGNFAGVGFMLGDGWVGIDFDNYRDKETGYLFPPVLEAVERFGTYAEVSPSETGVKIIGRGKMPEGVRNRTGKDKTTGQEIEVYGEKRFFTVTSEKLPQAPAKVAQMPDEFAVFCHEFLPPKDGVAAPDGIPEGSPGSLLTDDDVIKRAEKSRSGDKFRRLMAGDTSKHGGDDSSADFALALMLVFWTGGDAAQIERIMRRSALGDGREQKWARPDYMARTIDNAIEMHMREERPFYGQSGKGDDTIILDPSAAAEAQSSPELKLGHTAPAPIHRYMRDGVEEPSILIDGLLYDGTVYADGTHEGAVHTWYGEPGCGKSLIALWACIQVMRGGENALYIDEEGTKRLVSERLDGLGVEPELIEERFYYYSRPQLTTDPGHLDQLTSIAETIRPGLVIFDSWIDFLANDGRSENSSDEVTQWAAHMTKPLMDVGASIVILDHVPKDGSGRGARGSGGKLGWIAAGHKVTVSSVFNRHTVGEVKFVTEKDREAALPHVIKFAIGGNGDGRIICHPDTQVIEVLDDNGLAPTTRAILDELPTAGPGYTAWFRATGIGSKSTFQTHLERLVKAGLVKHEGTLYMPVTSGPVVQSGSGPMDQVADQSGPVSPPMGETDGPPDQDQREQLVEDEVAQQRERTAQVRGVVANLIASGTPIADEPELVAEATRATKVPQSVVQRVVATMTLSGEINPSVVYKARSGDLF